MGAFSVEEKRRVEPGVSKYLAKPVQNSRWWHCWGFGSEE